MWYSVSDAVDFLKNDFRSCDTTERLKDLNMCILRLVESDQAPERLLERWIRFETTSNVLPMPREVQAVTGVHIGGEPRMVFNQGYEFLLNGPGNLGACMQICPGDLIDDGERATMFDVPGINLDTATGARTSVPWKLLAMVKNTTDAALTIKVLGKDTYNADILTSGELGETFGMNMWTAGIEGAIQLASAAVSGGTTLTVSTNSFRDVTVVVKPVTLDFVNLYAYRASDHRMYFLAKYHPHDTKPAFRRYRLPQRAIAAGGEPRVVTCKVKLGYVPVRGDDDILLIQSLPALRFMLQALNFEAGLNYNEANKAEANALRILNARYASSQPPDNPILQIQDASGANSIKNVV